MRVKNDDVSIAHLNPGLVWAIIVADQCYAKIGVELVITSGNDGNHASTSLHYANSAVDLRTHTVDEAAREPLRDLIKNNVGVDFDVILEEDHIHMELQPRRR